MHDVLAHSLSALALQLEGARLLARDRGPTRRWSTPSSARTTWRAAGSARRGRRSRPCAATTCRGSTRSPTASATAWRSRSRGEPRELASEARLALYRTAQEALTNVTRHSAAERVELRLDYEDDGTRLVVQDCGPAMDGGASAAAAATG